MKIQKLRQRITSIHFSPLQATSYWDAPDETIFRGMVGSVGCDYQSNKSMSWRTITSLIMKIDNYYSLCLFSDTGSHKTEWDWHWAGNNSALQVQFNWVPSLDVLVQLWGAEPEATSGCNIRCLDNPLWQHHLGPPVWVFHICFLLPVVHPEALDPYNRGKAPKWLDVSR